MQHNNLIYPQHVAIIMDGNGRWAKKRNLPRIAGHIKGVQAVKNTVKACIKHNIKYLTLFAFSSENWRRPIEEVNFLIKLLNITISKQIKNLIKQNIKLKIIGDLTALPRNIQDILEKCMNETEQNLQQKNILPVLNLTVAINYGGKYDILNAVNTYIANNINIIKSNLETNTLKLNLENIDHHLTTKDLINPDLMIRTGGEQRISNFMLWQMAYTELYFTDTYWPDFNEEALLNAINSYNYRERRFGKTSEQVQQNNNKL